MENIEFFSLLSFTVGIASLIVAVIAIWLALYHKNQTDKINSQTKDILVDIKSDAKIISKVALPELKAYGDSMREFVLHKDKPKENKPDFQQELSESLKKIENTLVELQKEPNIEKIKTGLGRVENRLKKSHEGLQKSKIRGIHIKISDTLSVGTSNEEETWNDLLDFLFGMNKDLNRDDYLKTWKLIVERNDFIIPKKYITDTSYCFDDLKLLDGDKIVLKKEN